MRLSLSVWLALVSIGLVLLLVGGLVPAGVGLLGQFAAESAHARVELAALGAAEGIERYAEGARTGARLLAERPTLLRLLAGRQTAELQRFLESFCATAELDGCAVVQAGAVLAAAPPTLPWAALGANTEDLRYLFTGELGPLVLGEAGLAGQATTRTLVARRLDEELTAALTEQIGLAVRIGQGPADAEPTGTTADYRARRALGGEGEAALWLETVLPASEATAPLRRLQRGFALVALLAAALAVLTGILAGRTLARPLRTLRQVASRIGAGDLVTPVPPTPGLEASALALAMEEMRQRLRSLTAELRRREAEAQVLLTGIVEGVFAVDGDRRIQYLNPQAAALLGIVADGAVGRFCGDVLRPAGLEGQRPCETACPIVHARSRGSSRAVEHLQLPAGRRTVVITSAPPAGGAQPQVQVQVLRDETEIETARRSRDAVLANVSHELKTPLSAQLASIELLRDGLGSMEHAEVVRLVAALERSTLRLTRLIDNLLESVRIETGQSTLRRVPLELAVVVADAAAMTRPLLDQRDQELVVELPQATPALEGDPGQLTQVFVNLLANAHKYAPAGSTIRLGGEAVATAVSVWVEDAGPGVEPAASSSIFDRFHRADVGSDGMGLGLWIVKSIVERHGGTVSVGASAQGGARFTVHLPAAGAS